MPRERRVDVQGVAAWGRMSFFALHPRRHSVVTHSPDQLQVDPTWAIEW